MYEYRPKLRAKGLFPIVRTYQGKTRAEAIAEMATKERIEQQQNSKEVPPKDIPEIPTSQAFEEGSNSESGSQKEELVASPQLEDGFTRISNEILEALARINLSGYQSSEAPPQTDELKE